MESEKAFWLVWRDGATRADYRHETFESARTEATRLSGANPGAKFHVLRPYGYVLTQVPLPPTNWHPQSINGGPRDDPRYDFAEVELPF